MFPYNIVETQCTHLIHACAEKNIGFIDMKPLAGGAIEDADLAMRFVCTNPDVTVVIPGMYNLDEITQNLQAVQRTEALTAEGVTKAAVETVAENASDGVIAPLLYMLLGGAPLALTYKAINTMDSMLGYKNEKYLYFGRAAAKLDDVANYIPSRLAALLWIMAAAFTRNDAKGAWRIWRRDRRNHASPNSAQTESACAGALGVQLAGPAYYFGEYYPKPTIGDPLRPIEPEDILRADRMMYVASGFALAFGCAIRGFLG